ncbi:DUF3667 domain-containing protein [Winogradskyella alexanderae]|uniref:DUF3667 domain-containing protein n=1 Tax=Winogradskyella alexanderae TaxID=2877123 RepID=A0ABS7XXY2_9FLAO|nr:DUF3667 domain-containing protein [Winogradskyella alexanderae]MCA0133851.1 DUF3667 domain-containing protein [Winogradskyella alexanderae]
MLCKNCHTELNEHDDYCRNCGARVIRNRLTFRNLFEHLSETFFNYDNKLLRTVIDLFKKPEDVIVGYINGVRKKYVNPISLFGLALTITGIYMIIINKFFPEMIDFSNLAVEGQEEFQRRNTQFVQEYQSIIVMLYVPIYALMAKLVFFDKKRFNYTELLVVFMYIQAQISIVSAVLTIIIGIIGYSSSIVGMFMLLLMILYSAFALKRIYKLSFFDIVVRTLLFLVVLAITFVIFTVLLLVFMYFNGELQEMIQAQKAASETAKTG